MTKIDKQIFITFILSILLLMFILYSFKFNKTVDNFVHESISTYKKDIVLNDHIILNIESCHKCHLLIIKK